MSDEEIIILHKRKRTWIKWSADKFSRLACINPDCWPVSRLFVRWTHFLEVIKNLQWEKELKVNLPLSAFHLEDSSKNYHFAGSIEKIIVTSYHRFISDNFCHKANTFFTIIRLIEYAWLNSTILPIWINQQWNIG